MKPFRIIMVFALLLSALPAAAENHEIHYAGVLGADNWISSIAFSHNGKMLAVSTKTGIWIIPIRDGVPVKVLSNPNYPDETVSLSLFSADDSELWYTRIYAGEKIFYRLEKINIASGEHSVFADNAIMAQWSQDGSCIYYYRKAAGDANTYTLVRYDTATGTVTDIVSAGDMSALVNVPRYSARFDNMSIAAPCLSFIKYEYIQNLCIYRLDGSKEQVTFFNHGSVDSPMYSPDGQKILYSHNYRTATDGGSITKTALLLYNVATKKHYVIADWKEADSFNIQTWSPEGDEIWYLPSVSTDVNVIDLKLGELSELESFAIDTEPPKNTIMVFDKAGYDKYNAEIRSTTTVDVSANGPVTIVTQWSKKPLSGVQQINAFDWYLERGQQFPVYSPDGSFIALTDQSGCGIWLLSPSEKTLNLVYINAQRIKSESKNIDFYTRGNLKQPLCFSPEGEIVFREFIYDEEWGSSAATDGQGNLLSTKELIPVLKSVNPQTHEARMLVKGAYDLSYSPDGGKIVYAAFNKNRDTTNPYTYEAGIYVRDVEKGTEFKLTDGGRLPVVSHDGSAVYYYDQTDGGSCIFKVPIGGGAPLKVSDSLYWMNPKISPDGEWLVGEVIDKTGASGSNHPAQWLRAINLNTGAEYDFIPPYPYIRASEFSFSPNGSHMCYSLLEKEGMDELGRSNKHIYIADFNPNTYFKPTAVGEDTPGTFAVTGVYPNPFNMSTTIEYTLPHDGFVTLSIYNIMGQKIRDLVFGFEPRGKYSLKWEGRDQNDIPVSSGIYFSHLKLGEKVSTKRMMLLK
jgi:Tol biopolymer transport system component